MDSIIHFEIPADDTERASTFYKETFGWQLSPMPEMNYTILTTTELGEDNVPKKPGAINGGMYKRSAELTGTMVTINVPNIDASLAEIVQNGGMVMREKRSIGDKMGYVAYFKDTEGNVVGLWQS